ncbi:unnamed protein product [Phaedon cochleariae]|uniref:Uncharacterized protein n=1 Tax=Phaedon cochleariae TaxID=80249 RepID=A0A9P0DJE7_PHACE|nr:unnamed protein product [Phaedon cochleariae]
MATKLFNLTKICTQVTEKSPIPKQSKRFLSESMRKKYERFQIDDGVPVYKKNGAPDVILLSITTLLIAIGLADGLYSILQLSFPRKK